ncbi:fatty acid desaturase [Sphingomonas immobilis]|uniref:Fatty acid desaturase n=1 Tax=Sphingomonas immobilis TaxID=3063997 RepID=A0ABT9A1Z4_9SPHN|nr:fatty acid desaturase [Sphingomonas sp. CA1-15]MDO7843021.1 fatty acid desaturase [Sphingomonas sp. CA1-15]
MTAIKSALADVAWRDLTPMRRRDGLVECCHPLPWLLASLAAAALGWWPVAAGASFMLFLTALRLNHEAIHHNLGFDARGHRIVLHALSALMLGSNTAVAFNHLQHHKHIGTDCDLEGACGRMTMARVLVHGPLFPLRMHVAAWQDGGPAVRRRMRIDAALNLAVIAAVTLSGSPVLLYHVAAMAVAQCLTAFFAVWITHHDLAPEDVARTQHSALVNLATYNMLLHLEHHLFPGVPVKRLGRLAARIAAAAPDVAARERLVVPEPWR